MTDRDAGRRGAGRADGVAPNDHPVERLVAYLDRELPAGAHDMVETHLALCAACRAELDALTRARARVRAVAAAGPIRPVWPSVRARLRPAREVVFTPWFRVAAGAAAIAGFAIVLALGLGTQTPRAGAADPLASLGSSLSPSAGIEIADAGSQEAGS